MFDAGYLSSLVDQHQAGVSDHSSALWSLMMFESFLRNVHERPLQPCGFRERREPRPVS
jgi:asparagine synthase (glutamine-hydrolysing)